MKFQTTALRLREALSKNNMRPQDLANASGVSKASISQYLNGTHAPSNISSGKMAKVLGVSAPWLMGYDVDTPAATSEDNMARALDFYERYEKASPEIKTAIEALLKATKNS